MHIRNCFAFLAALAALPSHAADKLTVPQLIEMAHKNSRDFAGALRALLGDDKIAKGTAFAGEGADFIWAVETDSRPAMFVDDRAAGSMQRVGETNLWFYIGELKTGTAHSFYYTANGARIGGSHDVPAYGPDSYPKPGAPEGKLWEKIVHTSKIYE